MQKTRKKLFMNLILLVVVLIICFFIIEVTIRLIFGPGRIQDSKGNTPYIDDPDLGYKLKPNYRGYFKEIDFNTDFNTNKQGFRSPDFSLSDKNIIFILGDSFIAGSGVEENETLSYFLQQDIPDYKIYNLGIPGYSQSQHVVQLENMLPLYNPELIIAHFYAGNDITDNCGPLPTINKNKTAKERVKEFIKRSQFISLFYRKLIVPYKYPKNLDFYINDSSVEKCYEITREHIKDIKEITSAYNKELIFVIIPREQQTVQEEEEELIEWYDNFEKFDVEKFDLDIINKRVLEMCEEFKMDCLDLTSAFKKKDKQEQLYLNDGHWNKNGHKLASDIVLEYLQENGYLP